MGMYSNMYDDNEYNKQNSVSTTLDKVIKKRNLDTNSNEPENQVIKLKSELLELGSRVVELRDELIYAENPLHFLYEKTNMLVDEQNWCFDNDIVSKIMVCRIIGKKFISLVVKTEEDAMAYKLKWFE